MLHLTADVMVFCDSSALAVPMVEKQQVVTGLTCHTVQGDHLSVRPCATEHVDGNTFLVHVAEKHCIAHTCCTNHVVDNDDGACSPCHTDEENQGVAGCTCQSVQK